MANTNHIVICAFAFYNFIVPDCENPYPFKWFADEVCFLSVDVKFGAACSLFMGYLLFDFLLAVCFIRVKDEMTNQMHFHHLMACVSILVALISGYGLNGIANLLLMMEVSTVALNDRNMYDKE